MKIGTSVSIEQKDNGYRCPYGIGRIHRMSKRSYRWDTLRNGTMRGPIHGKTTTFDSARVALHRAFNRPIEF